ncbi:hypothetical protein Hanom_Chr17g01529931 [Helianthus anomalus]
MSFSNFDSCSSNLFLDLIPNPTPICSLPLSLCRFKKMKAVAICRFKKIKAMAIQVDWMMWVYGLDSTTKR